MFNIADMPKPAENELEKPVEPQKVSTLIGMTLHYSDASCAVFDVSPHEMKK